MDLKRIISNLRFVLKELSFWTCQLEACQLEDRTLQFQQRELRKYRRCCDEARDCSILSDKNRDILSELIQNEPTLRALSNAAIGSRLNQLEKRATVLKPEDYQIWLKTRSAAEAFWHLIDNLALVREATSGQRSHLPLYFHAMLEEDLKRCLAGLSWLQRILDDGQYPGNREAIVLLERFRPWLESMRKRLSDKERPLSMSELWELRGSEDELSACGAAPMLSLILQLAESYETYQEQDSMIRKWLNKAVLLANFAIYSPSWMFELEQGYELNI